MLASPEAMSDVTHPEDAEALRRSCRRRTEPTIVACSIGAGRAQLGWAHRILDKLEPTVTWAVVEASCKAEDIGHRVALLGGVDVLALTGVADTAIPPRARARHPRRPHRFQARHAGGLGRRADGTARPMTTRNPR